MKENWFSENKEWIIAGSLFIVFVIAVSLIIYFVSKNSYDAKPYSFTKNTPLTKSTSPGSIIYNATCGDGTFITRFGSKLDNGINQLSATCSNQQVLGPFGTRTTGSSAGDVVSDNGFTQANVWYDDRVMGINIFNGKEFNTLGSLIGNEMVQDCGADGRIVGLSGNGDGFVNNLGMICGYKDAQ